MPILTALPRGGDDHLDQASHDSFPFIKKISPQTRITIQSEGELREVIRTN